MKFTQLLLATAIATGVEAVHIRKASQGTMGIMMGSPSQGGNTTGG